MRKTVKNIEKLAKVANLPKISKNRENPVKNIENSSKILKNQEKIFKNFKEPRQNRLK